MTHSLSRPTLEVLEDRTVPSGGPNANPAAAYVQALYLDVLGRQPSGAEQNYWGSIVGSYGAAAAVSGILNSIENQDRLINNLYVELLGRNADAAGLSWWRGALDGNGLEAVTAGILASPEFVAKQGGNVVSADYEQLLGRPPGAAELAYWTPILSGAGPRAVGQGIVASTEYRADFTQTLFEANLNRAASASELAYFANNHALSLLQIEASILTSPEFVGAS
jgi:hypothetical protein